MESIPLGSARRSRVALPRRPVAKPRGTSPGAARRAPAPGRGSRAWRGSTVPRGRAPAADHTVHVQMRTQVLAPGVDHRDPDFPRRATWDPDRRSARSPRLGGDRGAGIGLGTVCAVSCVTGFSPTLGTTCRLRCGAEDMIGNLGEWTGSQMLATMQQASV